MRPARLTQSHRRTAVDIFCPAATILACLTVASLVLSPKQLGSENSRLFALQKSGIVTIILALLSFVVTLVSFCIEIAVAIPARNRLNNAADGISASLVRSQPLPLHPRAGRNESGC